MRTRLLRRAALPALAALLVAWAAMPVSPTRVTWGAAVTAPDDTVVSAPQPASTPVGVPASHPVLVIEQRRLVTDLPGSSWAQFMSGYYPTDFHFTYRIVGYNFPPHENVTISVSNAPVQPIQVTAEAGGFFVAEFSFAWRFCGPSGRQDPAPVFTARATDGSMAQLTDKVSCPWLQVWEIPPAVPPTPTSATGGVVSVQPAAPPPVVSVCTVDLRPPTPTQVCQPTPTPSGPTSTPTPTVPIPTPVPISAQLEGFGFVPREHVRVEQQLTGSADSTPPPASGVADAEGRLLLTMPTYGDRWAIECGRLRIEAIGDRGTQVSAGIHLFRGSGVEELCPPAPDPTSQIAPSRPASAGSAGDMRGTLANGWQRHTLGGKGSQVAVDSVYADDSGFLALGNSGSWVSGDGMRWKPAPTNLLSYVLGQHITDLNLVRVGLRNAVAGDTYSVKAEGPNGGYIAVGSYKPPGQPYSKTRAEVALSSDGHSWHTVSGKGKTFLGATMKDVARGVPGWVAVGFSWGPITRPVIWTSTDAVHWQRIPHQPAGYGQIDQVIHGPAGLLAYANGLSGPATVWASSDGVRWKVASGSSFRGAFVRQISVGGTGYLAAGVQDDEPALWTSSDGLRWLRAADAASFPGDQTSLQGVAERGNTVVVVGRYGTVSLGQYGARFSQPITSAWVWTPQSSALQPTPVPRTGTISAKAFRLRLSDLPAGYIQSDGGWADLCDDGSTLCRSVYAAVGSFGAYQASSGSNGRSLPITQIESMEIEGSRSKPHALASLGTPLIRWWNRSGPIKRVMSADRIGQETRVYRGTTPAPSIPPGGNFVVFAVEWRDGNAIGQVYVAQQPKGPASATEKLALDLARALWKHLKDALG